MIKIHPINIPDCYIVEPALFLDNRGFFLESYSYKDFCIAGISTTFVQDNHSCSKKKGTLRGLHVQLPPFTQAKLIRVTKGSVFDVVVDLRKGSPSYGKWYGIELKADTFKMFYIPKGCAHGFCTLEDDTEFMYKNDQFYTPSHERSIKWNDPILSIDWPVIDPILSEKDIRAISFSDFDNPF